MVKLLLPGMTDTELKDLIDWNAEDFEKSFTLHIWEMFDWDDDDYPVGPGGP